MAAAPTVDICFVGSGVVNFGGTENPWNHSIRLEKLGGIRVVAIIDPLTDKADEILQEKLAGSSSHLYKGCKVYGDIATALKENNNIKAAFIGVPPIHHGSFSEGKDVELQLLNGGINLFVEKPVSVIPPEEFNEYVSAVTKTAADKDCVVSVGYMFRYHPAIIRIKEEIKKYGRPLVALNARYSCTCSNLKKVFWWNSALSGGPIIEQATHFCDLVRYIGGEVELDSVKGYNVPFSANPTDTGFLTSIPKVVLDADIPEDKMAPCATQCVWRFKNGGIGTLTHTLLLHDHQYETGIDMWCDGLYISLLNPYLPQCTLKIRKSGSIEESVETFPGVDTYFEEINAFMRAVSSKSESGLIRSTYEDAAKTYELSWAIRRATTQQK